MKTFILTLTFSVFMISCSKQQQNNHLSDNTKFTTPKKEIQEITDIEDNYNKPVNPNLIIDLTEKEAFQRYKNSNVRKALGLKLKDFNYKELIQFAQADKLSEIIILNNHSQNTLESIKNTYDLGKVSLNRLRKTGVGYPCEDCEMIVYSNIKNLNAHPFYK